jgi:hypothetical protein
MPDKEQEPKGRRTVIRVYGGIKLNAVNTYFACTVR